MTITAVCAIGNTNNKQKIDGKFQITILTFFITICKDCSYNPRPTVDDVFSNEGVFLLLRQVKFLNRNEQEFI